MGYSQVASGPLLVIVWGYEIWKLIFLQNRKTESSRQRLTSMDLSIIILEAWSTNKLKLRILNTHTINLKCIFITSDLFLYFCPALDRRHSQRMWWVCSHTLLTKWHVNEFHHAVWVRDTASRPYHSPEHHEQCLWAALSYKRCCQNVDSFCGNCGHQLQS